MVKKLPGKDFSEKAQRLCVSARTDKEALSELICMYMQRIQRTVVFMAKSPDEVSDLTQEGLMGLCDAVKSYDENKGALFTTYADVCIRNKILSALRKAPAATDEMTEEILDEKPWNNPEHAVVDMVRADEIIKLVSDSLSKNEWQVFEKYLEDKPYVAIAEELGTTVKAVDNAMQRVRKKLKAVLSEES